jgi:hypothetical protein
VDPVIELDGLDLAVVVVREPLTHVLNELAAESLPSYDNASAATTSTTSLRRMNEVVR